MVVEDLFLGLEVQYSGRRLTLAGDKAKDYWLTNLTLFSQNLIEDLELTGSIYNVFDENYEDPGAGEHEQDTINQNDRSFRTKLTYRF